MATLKLKGKEPKKSKDPLKDKKVFTVNKKSKDTLIALFVLGMVLVALGIYLRYYNSILSFKNISEYPKTADNIAYARPVKLAIPSISVEVPVTEGGVVNGVWEISQNMASYMMGSALPGQKGNIVIYGHNKDGIFGSLKGVKEGDYIFIKDEQGEIHKYKVNDVQVVSSSAVEVVLPTDHEELTVYTCTGLLDSKRLVVKAVPEKI